MLRRAPLGLVMLPTPPAFAAALENLSIVQTLPRALMALGLMGLAIGLLNMRGVAYLQAQADEAFRERRTVRSGCAAPPTAGQATRPTAAVTPNQRFGGSMRTSTTARAFYVTFLAGLALAAVLTACGTAPTTVTITVTSHGDGDRITGSRSVTLAGTLAGGPVTAFQVTLNGTTVGATTHTATSFDAPLTLGDGANALTITATSAAGITTESLALTYPFLAFSDFASARTVIGQPNATSSASALTSSGLQVPYGDPALVNGVLYVADSVNNRVLGFTGGVPSTDGASADFVLGQPDFTTGTVGSDASGLNTPQSVTADRGMLYLAPLVTDNGNNRVLVYRP